ncbi:MAG: hypothetical protein Q7J54_05635 [Candidatus Woesearchaeota archaeon]|nr:hypothetical protein [Candidatus Woesearchaeota archaeon]
MKTLKNAVRAASAGLGLLCLASMLCADETEYRAITQTSAKITDKVGVWVRTEDRWKKGDNYYDEEKIGFDFTVGKYLALSPAVCNRRVGSSDSDIAFLTVSTSKKMGNTALVGALTEEYNLDAKTSLTEPFVKIARPVKLGDIRMAPYAYDLAFISNADGSLRENRIGVGIELPLAEKIKLAVEYAIRDMDPAVGKNSNMYTVSVNGKF